MAIDKAVDSAQLNAGLTTIANAIREKAGVSDNFTFPAGFAEAIAAIEAGGEVYPNANGVTFPVSFEFPPLPEGVIEAYPYAIIRENNTSGYYDLVFNNTPWYYESNDDCLYEASKTNSPWYRIEISSRETATEWIYYQSGTTTNAVKLGLSNNRPLVWASHDIPKGTASDAETYFYKSGRLSDILSYTVDASDISAIASAIRSKDLVDRDYNFPSGFVKAIESGLNKVNVKKGSITPATATTEVTFTHNLGMVPNAVYFTINSSLGGTFASDHMAGAVLSVSGVKNVPAVMSFGGVSIQASQQYSGSRCSFGLISKNNTDGVIGAVVKAADETTVTVSVMEPDSQKFMAYFYAWRVEG